MRHNRGTAIVLALFITALVAAIAVTLMLRVKIDTQRTRLTLDQIQANLYADGALLWAKNQLRNDALQQHPDQAIDRLPLTSPDNVQGGVHIRTIITDAQSQLNLNNLNDPLYQALFARLIQLLAPSTRATDIKKIIAATTDWITRGAHNTAFDQRYAKATPAIHHPHQLFASVSELENVAGMTPALYQQLAPYLTALPNKTPLNINSMPKILLMSLADGITDTMASALIAQRPFASLNALAQFPLVKNSAIAQNGLTVISQYFLIQTNIRGNSQQMTRYSLLMRQTLNGKPTITVLWQSQGTL